MKGCHGAPGSCNATPPEACVYIRHRRKINGQTTVLVQYACATPSLTGALEIPGIPDVNRVNCSDPYETDVALFRCCYTDFCNQNFSKQLPFEMTITPTPTATATPTATPTVTPTDSEGNGELALLHCMWIPASRYTMFVCIDSQQTKQINMVHCGVSLSVLVYTYMHSELYRGVVRHVMHTIAIMSA